ncbi:CHAT domain-containing protein [Streptomyces sp. DSM 44915]|uniref:CHAT domain-containing protein n=1 Tax=Streptomyces chisholmiae TaxID=3075540 RepID=A0ABU2JW89_9ACTN|nr:CHAT domain-containing protein [Streptomyces sp. DSM 44915]MDT0269001.1 CHAT domain-containing protein [Streptomyces sp. DSM 44915]
MDAEVARALARAERMLPSLDPARPATAAPPGPTHGPPLDKVIEELAALERELGDGAAEVAVLRARLGALYGRRYLRGEGPWSDREEGIRLLRAARAANGPGAVEGPERLRATLLLATLLLPIPQPERDGGPPSFERMLAWSMAEVGQEERRQAELAELEPLVVELEAAGLPEPMHQEFALLRSMLSRARVFHSAGDPSPMVGFLQQLMREHPEKSRERDLVEASLGLLDLAGPLVPPTESAAPPAASAEAPNGPPQGEASDEWTTAVMAMLGELRVPGVVGAERLGELVGELVASSGGVDGDGAGEAMPDAALGAAGQAVLGTRTGSPELLEGAYHRMGEAGQQVPADGRAAWMLRMVLGSLLPMVAVNHGNLRDEAEALRLLGSLGPEPVRDVPASPGSTSGDQLAVLARVGAIALRLGRLTCEAEDVAGVTAALAELEELAGRVEEGQETHWVVVYHLAFAYLARARALGSVADLRAGLDRLRELRERPTVPSFMRQLVDTVWPMALAASATLERDPEQLLDVVASARAALTSGEPVAVNERAKARWGIAQALRTYHELTGDRPRLTEAVEELRAARGELVAGTDRGGARVVLWALAEAHAERREPGDLAAAVEAGLAALDALADDVLMQLGAEHGLETARAGAEQALRVAEWAVAEGDVANAVRALETGRALVLRAAAASASVPEQLAALGLGELADEWRRAVPGEAASAPGGFEDGPAIPSRLRRRALDALRPARAGRRALLAVPELAELASAVEASGADALVYLLPGQGAADGAALVIGRGDGPAGATVLPLPGLSAAGRAPLERYLGAAARRSAAAGADGAGGRDAAWEAALDELCDWAGPAVMGPLLARLAADGGTGSPPRIVLVPCGNLGVVPWHAARVAAGYVCQVAVVSYAASGAQFVTAAGRARLAPRARPVLVADPRLDLLWAADEVTTLSTNYYQRAALYGEFLEEPAAGVRGAGTPAELLAELAGRPGAEPVSLLHIASHGEAGTRPTVSALALAEPPEPPEPPDASELSDPEASAGPDGAAGALTVARLLDGPADPAADGPGPLVVLSACETDLSRRDHDEALTLTTAFVARGATDAVGSRWTAGDGASALLMAVFHHHLAVEGLAPADALRAAQLWMLDPARRPPPGLVGELAREAAQPSLDRLSAWAAFIHQGSPRPATRTAGTTIDGTRKGE